MYLALHLIYRISNFTWMRSTMQSGLCVCGFFVHGLLTNHGSKTDRNNSTKFQKPKDECAVVKYDAQSMKIK
jgi:hypothetical protein